jgi:HAE1 family hydrophobic/amphiphilic exporter-1
MVMQTAGSNANEIIKNIDKLTTEINSQLPKGVVLKDLMSTKDFLDASISKVIETLVEAILLVIIVVYIFLQSVRSTIIPSISIIVSLIGTFAFIYLAGFSINLLTLFALVLVIGTVVDDAIVVVEAVQARFDEGYVSRVIRPRLMPWAESLRPSLPPVLYSWPCSFPSVSWAAPPERSIHNLA